MNAMAIANKPTKHAPDKKNAAKHDGGSFDLVSYLKGVKSEWHKVSWPTWPHIWGQMIVVVVMVAVMTFGLWAIDNIFRIAIGVLTTGKFPG